jgi:hypothetical protein
VAQVLLTVILGDSSWFKVLGVGLVGDAVGEGGEAIVVVIIVVPGGPVPSPCFNNKPRVMALVDFLPEVDHGSIMEVGLDWILALVLCPTLVARGLLYFLFIVATPGWRALIALVIVVPLTPMASSWGATDQRGITMLLRPRELIPSGRHRMLPIKLHERVLGQVLQPLNLRIGWELLS